MIYCIVGTDSKKRNLAGDTVVARFASQNFPVHRFGAKELPSLAELAGSTGLFFEKHVSVFEHALEKKEHADILVQQAEVLRDSPNIFVFIEQTLLKDAAEAFKKHAESFEVFDLPAKKWGDGGFNVFALTDAFAKRDKKSLWILYQQALSADIAPEEILHKLFWQVKMLLIAKSSPNAEQLKKLAIKEYTYDKSKSSAKNFTDAELRTFSFDLVSILQEGRRGTEISIALEKFLVGAF